MGGVDREGRNRSNEGRNGAILCRSTGAKLTVLNRNAVRDKLVIVDDNLAGHFATSSLQLVKIADHNNGCFNRLAASANTVAEAEDGELLDARFDHRSPLVAASLELCKNKVLELEQNKPKDLNQTYPNRNGDILGVHILMTFLLQPTKHIVDGVLEIGRSREARPELVNKVCQLLVGSSTLLGAHDMLDDLANISCHGVHLALEATLVEAVTRAAVTVEDGLQ